MEQVRPPDLSAFSLFLSATAFTFKLPPPASSFPTPSLLRGGEPREGAISLVPLLLARLCFLCPAASPWK